MFENKISSLAIFFGLCFAFLLFPTGNCYKSIGKGDGEDHETTPITVYMAFISKILRQLHDDPQNFDFESARRGLSSIYRQLIPRNGHR